MKQTMKIIVKIKTPKGQASKTEYKIQPFILGVKKPFMQNYKLETKGSKNDDLIIWHIEAPPSKIFSINKKVAMYDKMIEMIFTNKWSMKAIDKTLSKEGQAELKDMLKNQTKIEIIKV